MIVYVEMIEAGQEVYNMLSTAQRPIHLQLFLIYSYFIVDEKQSQLVLQNIILRILH
jgi:hypothetical protein